MIKEIDEIREGDVFGTLEITELLKYKIANYSKSTKKCSYKRMCRYECSCGRTGTVGLSKIVNYEKKGKTNTCPACAYRNRPQSTKRFPIEKRLYDLSITSRCKLSKGRIENKLSLKDFTKMIAKNCHYCGAAPEKKDRLRDSTYAETEYLYANGIDRIDSNGHYEMDNIVPCCKKCNVAKATMDTREFLDHIKRVYNHSIKNKKTY